MTQVADTANYCPLCGEKNGCSIAAGTPAHDCWCRTARIDKEVLAALDGEVDEARCVCRSCGVREGESLHAR